MIRRQLIALSGAGIDEVVVVLGHYGDQIRPVIEEFPITIVDLPEKSWSSQRISVLVVPSDMPLLGGQDYIDLISAFKSREDGICMARPVVSEQPGNPVVFDHSIVDLGNKSNDPMCRSWWKHHPTECLAWRTDNSRYVVDLDTPEDVAEVEKRLGQSLRMPCNSEARSGVA